ncbi:hypothetical protein INP40_13275, partial [Staphylococcus aureus]|nr:hypothetical protein [Staphylococcus aureus]
LSMLEKNSIFGSKMLEIEDNIYIGTENIIWYQQTNKEQINLSIESTLQPSVYNTISYKYDIHTLVLDKSQTTSQMDTNTKWIMQINIKN